MRSNPKSKIFQLLAKSVSINNLRNIELHQQALSEKQGKIKLFLGDASHPNDHSIGIDRGSGSVEIDSTTLDDFWEASGKPRIDLIKIHVVGEDPSVLKGGEKLISEASPMLAIVYYPPRWTNESELERNLFERYDVFQIVESTFLIKKLEQHSLNRSGPTGLFLLPKKSFANYAERS